MKVLVTGASGLLGSHVSLCLQNYYHVIAQHNTNPVKLAGCTNVQCDLTKENEVKNLIDSDLDVVVHCAAYANIDGCEANNDLAISLNVAATKKIKELCSENNIRLIFISTNNVFSGTKSFYSESDNVSPINCYASTKCTAEKIVLEDTNNTVLRFVPIGQSITENHSFIDWVYRQLTIKNRINGFCDTLFNPVSVNTVSENIVRIIEKKLTGIYHLGSEPAVSKFQLIEKLKHEAKLVGRVNKSAIKDSLLLAPRPKKIALLAEKFSKDSGLPIPYIDDEVKKVVEFTKTRAYSDFKKMYKPKAEKIFAVVPALNEENTIAHVLDKLLGISSVIVVDDGSTDNTANVAAQHPIGAIVVKNKNNLGYDKAISVGFQRALQESATIIYTFDADGQHRIQDLNKLLTPVLENKCDIAVGTRKKKPRISEHIYSFLLRRLGILDPLCGMKVYRSYVFQTVGFFDNIGSIGTQLLIEAKLRGFTLKQKQISCNDRKDISRFGRVLVSNIKILLAIKNVLKHYRKCLLC